MQEITSYDELSAQVSALQKQVKYLSNTTEKLTAENKKLKAQNEWFMQQLKLSKQKAFGTSSVDYGQITFFNEAESERTALLPEPKVEEVIAENNIVLYDYREGRTGDFAKEFLKGFAGYLHCDGWHGYDKVEKP